MQTSPLNVAWDAEWAPVAAWALEVVVRDKEVATVKAASFIAHH